MMPNPLLPPLRRPPDDPTSLLLNGRVGWQADHMDNLVFGPAGELELDLLPEYRRTLTEPDGSFGGLALPTNLAITADGSLFLLDRRGPSLKLFDPCTCRFETVPAIGGSGPGPRQFSDPHGIGICAGNLYVCDTGNHRVGVFGLRGFALRGHWAPPASAGLANPWEPFDIAFDGAGRAYVSDGANGCIHRFSPRGHWRACFAGFGVVTALAMDCRDVLYAVTDGDPAAVHTLDGNGAIEPVPARPDFNALCFPPIPFEIDIQGQLHLETICTPQNGSPAETLFDLNGDPVVETGIVNFPTYESDGTYISLPLDSQLYRCQWHRIILHGALPSGCQVQVCTYTAEAALSEAELTGLPAEQWQTRQVARGMDDGRWDCLVRSGAGRYLWLKLVLHGNGMITPSLSSVEIEFPRLGLRRYLPAVFGEEPVSADFTDRFLSLYDTTLGGIESELDTLARYFDPLSAPADGPDRDFLSWLGMWIGVSLDRRWPEARRREFLKKSGELFALRGTSLGLWRQLLVYLGMQPGQVCCPGEVEEPSRKTCSPENLNCARPEKPVCNWEPPKLILEHFRLRRWLYAGAGRLNEDSVLWGKSIVNRSQLDENAQADRTQLKMTQDPYRDPFYVSAHKFTLFVPARYGSRDQDKKSLETLLKVESPAHTQFFVNYVAPRFRVGVQATIGLDSVIARIPEEDILSEAALGQDSVLGLERKDGPHFELGNGPRVGTTTVID
ncbi:MAG TPA: phage tail protein [Anaerolineales bacterium]|nr:phage tail protein [Anaerolineales bacterium]